MREKISVRPPEAGGSAVRLTRLASLVVCLAAACRADNAGRIAERILERYRREQHVRPLPPAGSIRMRLSPAPGASGEPGRVEIEWEGTRYRETVSSAGVRTVKGIEASKAFYTDEDGVTRVGSEPMLRELTTRSYFWRRGYLFEDRERARLGPGAADDATVSILLQPRGGNPLRLVFRRNDAKLVRAVGPRLRLEFKTPTRLRDLSRAGRDAEAVISWAGLPTRPIPHPAVGGWIGEFSGAVAELPAAVFPNRLVIPARVSGVPVRLELDASADGPLRIAAGPASKLGLVFRTDAFGRALASGASLELGPGLTFPALTVLRMPDSSEGPEAVAGGVLFRETVVEIDPGRHAIRFHDPARWVAPEGFFRIVLDDDGNRPVAVLRRSGRPIRLRAGTPAPAAVWLAGPTAAELGVSSDHPSLEGVLWGTLRLPALPVAIAAEGFDPDWGDDGAVGVELLVRFHTFLDMPHRWIYVAPLAQTAPPPL